MAALAGAAFGGYMLGNGVTKHHMFLIASVVPLIAFVPVLFSTEAPLSREVACACIHVACMPLPIEVAIACVYAC